MMTTPAIFTDEQLDYLRELVNVGGGSAAAAMEEMLHKPVRISGHDVEIYSLDEVQKLIEEARRVEACVCSSMSGDVEGQAFFLLAKSEYAKLIQAMREATPLPKDHDIEDMDILAEFGNITLGSYFTAVQQFCQLDIHYTPPVSVVNMRLALLDDAVTRQAHELGIVIAIRSEFLSADAITSVLLIVPDKHSLDTLTASLNHARAVLNAG